MEAAAAFALGQAAVRRRLLSRRVQAVVGMLMRAGGVLHDATVLHRAAGDRLQGDRLLAVAHLLLCGEARLDLSGEVRRVTALTLARGTGSARTARADGSCKR